MVDVVSKLLGGANRVKIMRPFLFNQGQVFTLEDMTERVSIPTRAVRKEIDFLLKSGFLIRQSIFKIIEKKRRGKIQTLKKRMSGFILSENIPQISELKNLLVDMKPFQNGDLVKKLSRAGRIKLVVLSGMFVGDNEGRVDLLIVGDKLDKSKIDKIIKTLELGLGRELRYSVLETADFTYRVSVYDRLVRDIFDYPHERVFDRISV